jgi:hypothetical protein
MEDTTKQIFFCLVIIFIYMFASLFQRVPRAWQQAKYISQLNEQLKVKGLLLGWFPRLFFEVWGGSPPPRVIIARFSSTSQHYLFMTTKHSSGGSKQKSGAAREGYAAESR